jgi:ribosomal protein S6
VSVCAFSQNSIFEKTPTVTEPEERQIRIQKGALLSVRSAGTWKLAYNIKKLLGNQGDFKSAK